MTPPDRIERACQAARKVAASPEAKELGRRTEGAAGVWGPEDEARLRKDGEIRIGWSTYKIGGDDAMSCHLAIRARLFDRVTATRALLEAL